jgi:hypothetical protein
MLKIFDDFLREEAVMKSLGENVAHYFRVLFTDQRGWNIRNDVCHGITPLPGFFPADDGPDLSRSSRARAASGAGETAPPSRGELQRRTRALIPLYDGADTWDFPPPETQASSSSTDLPTSYKSLLALYASGLPRVSPHVLRHTFASVLIEPGEGVPSPSRG